MPHTNRKKKASNGTTKPKPTIVHTKRKEILDSDGWTHVVDKPRTRSGTLNSKIAEGKVQGGDFERNGVWYVNRTIDELTKEVEYWKKGWLESTAAGDLKELLSGKDVAMVKDVVVLGLGTMQSARREGRRTSATQLAALQSMMEIFRPTDAVMKLNVICQDPQFTEVDEEYLTSLGYEVVANPDAFGRINQGSLVFAVHCYKDIYEKVADAKPAIMVGTEVDKFAEFDQSQSINETQKKLETMVDGCEVLDFPQLRHDFSDTKIYWRDEVKTIQSS